MSLLLATDFAPDTLQDWAAQLREALPGETVLTQRSTEHDASIDVALVANPPAGALQGLPQLKFIQSMWAGVDKLLRDDTIPTDVLLARMVDPAMSTAMAETALWAVLSLHRDHFGYAAQQRAGEWRHLPQRRADEVHVAVLGLGEMGRTVAQRLAANGYPVIGWSRREAELPGVASFIRDAALPTVLGLANIVINLLPLTARTHSLFNALTFSQMKPGTSFVNLARGQQVVEVDLLGALNRGHLHHAVLDVFQTEPLPAAHAFWSHPKVTVLPHAAAQTDLRSATRVAVANVIGWRHGRTVKNLVDRARGY
ncbi:MAG: glyoxylate/hydroxypyruvate reductase A [Cytophagales bacterium]|nr:glyoxylate/hydroxypyruvate reductase A [Rhizobacter sp.]